MTTALTPTSGNVPGNGPPSAEFGAVADDVLIFEHMNEAFTLVGATGRRAGWVGIVGLDASDDGLVGRAWRRGVAVRMAGRGLSHVAGPYYARNAVAVPVGQGHVVVYGGNRSIDVGEAQLFELAAEEVDRAHGASAHKLLADELELVHALRALMAYQPMTVRDTVRHVAAVAGQALSCEVAVIRLEVDGEPVVEGIDLRSRAPLAKPDADGHLATIGLEARVEQAAPPEPDIFGLVVASHLTIPIAGEASGALALGHTVERARGFTTLCQRIGRAIADAAELLISQAHAREQLGAERDLLARLVRTDALTGGANRRAWDDAVAAFRSEPGHGDAYVLSCDLDGLKAVNDRFGHMVGDALIRGASNLLASSVRGGDLVARVGGDEFVVLLAAVDAKGARRIIARIRRAQRAWRVTEHGLTPQLSIGLAKVDDGDLERARAAADRSMYASKRRHAHSPSPSTLDGRRASDRRVGSLGERQGFRVRS
ncbi:MAG TPA: GGDEF domain-containing protein [Candidatus Bathyarchaeia archaeon]|nr:GGDEF domain-containing protein [Candidatus Bathyarchaeia archaeon]